VTAGLFLRIMIRRWVFVAVGVVLTAFGCSALVNGERTYWMSTDLVFVQPGGGSVTNVSDAVVPSLINFAGLVQRRVHEIGTPVELPSSNVTLYGSGVRRGYSITLPNSGNQWAVSYTRPVLAVQAVGSSPEEVRRTLSDVLALVQTTVRDLQAAQGVPAGEFISMDRSPALPEVFDQGSTKAGRVKGLLAFGFLGVILTAFTVIAVDRTVEGRKNTPPSGRTSE